MSHREGCSCSGSWTCFPAVHPLCGCTGAYTPAVAVAMESNAKMGGGGGEYHVTF